MVTFQVTVTGGICLPRVTSHMSEKFSYRQQFLMCCNTSG